MSILMRRYILFLRSSTVVSVVDKFEMFAELITNLSTTLNNQGSLF